MPESLKHKNIKHQHDLFDVIFLIPLHLKNFIHKKPGVKRRIHTKKARYHSSKQRLIRAEIWAGNETWKYGYTESAIPPSQLYLVSFSSLCWASKTEARCWIQVTCITYLLTKICSFLPRTKKLA